MTLSFSSSTIIKQYLPGVYFISASIWLGFSNHSFWVVLISILFIIQMIFNNRYYNLVLGSIMIIASVYTALSTFTEIERTFKMVSTALSFTIGNLYMARMLFLNQNFSDSSLRENSLDEIMFL